MKIAIWKTGHPIADTVADALMEGLPNANIYDTHYIENSIIFEDYNHICYGILRGADVVFNKASAEKYKTDWFNLDRGYFKPSHYDGYYRISLRGTQQTKGLDKLEPDYERLKALNLDIKPWRGFDESKPILVCPPTEAVRKFFNVGIWFDALKGNIVIREKGDPIPINFNDYSHVVTFNSSVGWQALMAGIPCVSDPQHSIVGAWFKDVSIPDLAFSQQYERNRLFAVMAGLQLTLDEIRAGKIWEVMQKLLSCSSDSIAANPLPPTSLRTAFQSALKPHSA